MKIIAIGILQSDSCQAKRPAGAEITATGAD
jgi:hypothetical protein